MFLGHFHELLCVGWAVFGTVVSLVKNDMPSIFKFAGGGVLEPNVPAGGSKTKEDPSGGVVFVDLRAAYTGLLDGDVGSKDTDMGEVGASTCIRLKWCNTAG